MPKKKERDRLLDQLKKDFDKINEMLDAKNRDAYIKQASYIHPHNKSLYKDFGIPLNDIVKERGDQAAKQWDDIMPKFEAMYQRAKNRRKYIGTNKLADGGVKTIADNTHAVPQEPLAMPLYDKINVFNKNSQGLKFDNDQYLYIGGKKFRKVHAIEDQTDGGEYHSDTGNIDAGGLNRSTVNHEAAHALDYEYIPRGEDIERFGKMRNMFYKQASQLEPRSSYDDAWFGWFSDYMDRPDERYARWGEDSVFDAMAAKPIAYIDSAAAALPNMIYRQHGITPEYMDSLQKSTDDIYRTLTSAGLKNFYNGRRLYPPGPGIEYEEIVPWGGR